MIVIQTDDPIDQSLDPPDTGTFAASRQPRHIQDDLCSRNYCNSVCGTPEITVQINDLQYHPETLMGEIEVRVDLEYRFNAFCADRIQSSDT